MKNSKESIKQALRALLFALVASVSCSGCVWVHRDHDRGWHRDHDWDHHDHDHGDYGHHD